MKIINRNTRTKTLENFIIKESMDEFNNKGNINLRNRFISSEQHPRLSGIQTNRLSDTDSKKMISERQRKSYPVWWKGKSRPPVVQKNGKDLRSVNSEIDLLCKKMKTVRAAKIKRNRIKAKPSEFSEKASRINFDDLQKFKVTKDTSSANSNLNPKMIIKHDGRTGICESTLSDFKGIQKKERTNRSSRSEYNISFELLRMVPGDYLSSTNHNSAAIQTARRYGVNLAVVAGFRNLMNYLNVPVIDGTGTLRNNMYEIAVNLLLVYLGLRPSFLIQWIDYHPALRNSLRDLYLAIIDVLFEDGTFFLKNIDQGMLVIDSGQIRNVVRLITVYETLNLDTALGLALGYPAACELPVTGRRYVAHILTPAGGDVMSNICKDIDSLLRFYRFYTSIRGIVRHYLGITLQFQFNQLG